MSAVEWVSDTMRRYKGVSFPWRGIEDMEAQMAAIDRAEANKGGSRMLDLADHHDAWPELHAAKMEPEKAFQQRVVALAKECGWLVYHTFDARRSEPGFPDLILIRGEYMLAVELKTTSGKVTEAQEKWITAFARVGDVDARVWRPNDWPEIESMVR